VRPLGFSGFRPAVLLVALVLVAGTIGYMVVEGWSAWDALYMTVTTVTTVGFREVHPLSWRGQAFTVVLIIGGVSTVLYTLSLLAAGLVEGRIGRRFEQRRREHMIDALTNHFILCGAGRIGLIIADEFRRQQVPFVVIDRDPDAVQEVIARGDLAVEADASREDILQRLGIDRARGLIAALGTDAENVYAILTARGLRGDLFIVARADSDDAGRKLLRAAPLRAVALHVMHVAVKACGEPVLKMALVTFKLDMRDTEGIKSKRARQGLQLVLRRRKVDRRGFGHDNTMTSV